MIRRLRQAVATFVVLTLLIISFIGIMKLKDYSDFKKILSNLNAESRIAEVLVTGSRLDEITGDFITTIKFLEFDVNDQPLRPKYFTFHGNKIQFQSLVIRFKDDYVEQGHRLKGKSIYLFLKAFVLSDKGTQVFDISRPKAIPEGYKVRGVNNRLQNRIWARFWKYALTPTGREQVEIKNAQLEAPGSVFVPGTIYTIKIEHDGGMRIDTAPIPEVLRGELIRP